MAQTEDGMARELRQVRVAEEVAVMLGRPGQPDNDLVQRFVRLVEREVAETHGNYDAYIDHLTDRAQGFADAFGDGSI